jgi:CubicO group peptidase (beta-lactamase class C family)
MRSISALAALALLFSPTLRSVAQESPDLVPPDSEPGIESPVDVVEAKQARLTRADLEAWLDGFLNYALPRGDIAGGVVVVVKDGEVLLKKGYGYADVEGRKPVDPDLTLFRPGSVSKLITWTAVMQQVDQGKVDLDADINTYLDFEIPERDGQPVTMRNIMTHTTGFEEQVKGLMGVGEEVADLGEHLRSWVPERIFAPGETPAYSNYATALAGYIVERVCGMAFDDYVDQRIFEPLEMTHSTFRQPLPEPLEERMSKGYARASEPPKPFEIVGGLAPAGAMSTPGADMANFMIAHLQKGAFGTNRILEAATAELMHGTPLTILPEVNRMLLGFYETNYNGRRVIAHGGDTQWFHTYLHLFIDDGVGIYMSFNSSGREGAVGGLRTALFQQFADRYLPGDGQDGEVDKDTALEHARMIAGSYGNSRRSESNFFSILNLVGTVKVVANDDGTISVPLVAELGGADRWREIAPFLWREANGKNLLSAEVADGRIVRFSFDAVSPFMMFEPVPAHKSGGWLLPALVAGLGAMLLTTLAWPTAALVRRHYGARYGLTGQDAQTHRWVRTAAVGVLVLWIAWGVTLATMLADFSLLSPDLDGWLWVLQILSAVVLVAGAAIGIWNARVVLPSQRRRIAKLWAVVMALSFLAILWAALVYDLIAFDVNY